MNRLNSLLLETGAGARIEAKVEIRAQEIAGIRVGVRVPLPSIGALSANLSLPAGGRL